MSLNQSIILSFNKIVFLVHSYSTQDIEIKYLRLVYLLTFVWSRRADVKKKTQQKNSCCHSCHMSRVIMFSIFPLPMNINTLETAFFCYRKSTDSMEISFEDSPDGDKYSSVNRIKFDGICSNHVVRNSMIVTQGAAWLFKFDHKHMWKSLREKWNCLSLCHNWIFFSFNEVFFSR